MKKTTDDVQVIREARQAATRLADHERALRTQHAALTAERQRTWSALASRAEVHANNVRLVEAERRRFDEAHASAWVRLVSGYREIRGAEVEREVRTQPRLPDLHTIVNAAGALSFRDLCGLAPALVTARLAEMIDAQPAAAFGLPEAARQARLAELDIEIAGVERQHTELVDAAAEVGITLPLLVTVRQARDEAAALQAREAALEAERRKAAGAHA